MATNMPPHNLKEIGSAISAYIENPDISVDDLMTHVKGPDFPTGGTIFGRKGIKDAYRTGRGKILLRAKFEIETHTNGKESIIFTEIPYQTRTTDLVTKIGELARDKVIDGIERVNDGSHGDDVRIEVDLKRGAITKVVLSQLYSKTPLQSSYGIINLALVNGRPQILNLKQLIQCFVDHRDQVITRRSQFELKKAKHEEHILEAKITAVDCVDEVIQIIRSSKDEPEAKKRLEARFGFDEEQSQAIVDLRLGVLTNLRIDELKKQLGDVKALIAYLEDLLANHEKILGIIKDETNELAEKYGIATRPGAHCAPRMHQALNTVEQGAVRFSFSWFNTEEEVKASAKVSVEKAVEVESYVASTDRSDKLTKVVVVFKQARLQDFISAMEAIEITGITVTNVLGCGIEKGQSRYYRGAPLEINLLPKVKAEIVVCSVPVEKVVDAARKVLYTGNIGDGKIFIYDVENVIKVRTGEQGKVALLNAQE